ncbi:MAG: hypothetical protein A2033_10430 [Bacteroidetes bacterium GWA2_31_9]|nr:MAG: hypothetical protein A2033_10430 [Bacteroidetes bacterium GWA2_31_9]
MEGSGLGWKGSGVFAQNIAITDDDTYVADPSAMLDVKSVTKGMLVPRMTSAQRILISTPATGLLVFDTTEGSFFFYNGTVWVDLSAGGDVWSKNGTKIHLADSTNNVGVGTSNPQNKFIVKGDSNSGLDEAIFAVVSPAGDTLFAVYPDGTRIYVNDSPAKATSSKGGFAVGGFSPSKGITTNEYLRVTPDSVRVYIEENSAAKATSSKGGFAVGGFSPAKAQTFDSLFLFSDRTGLNVSFLTEPERDAIVNPRPSSIIFNTTDSCLQIYLGRWESIWCTTLNCVAPTVISSPVNQTRTPTGEATFIVSVVGTRLNLFWQESRDGGITWITLGDGGTNPTYSGAHNDTLLLTNLTSSSAGYKYRCYMYNNCGGNATSNSAELLPKIGDYYQGGILAYIIQSGDPNYIAGEFHGLIAATSNQSSSASWGCENTIISGADGTAIGTGSQNTIDIEAGCATAGTAADIAANLVINGYSDWYLPSKDELNKLYINKVAIGGFSSVYFWCSSEYSGSSAWKLYFLNGNQTVDYKNNGNDVRCVRSF